MVDQLPVHVPTPLADPARLVMPALVRTFTGPRDEAWSELYLSLEELDKLLQLLVLMWQALKLHPIHL
jgi:hypothetical protein